MASILTEGEKPLLNNYITGQVAFGEVYHMVVGLGVDKLDVFVTPLMHYFMYYLNCFLWLQLWTNPNII